MPVNLTDPYILVVEARPPEQSAIAEKLREADFHHLSTATRGEEAVAKLLGGHYDIVVADNMLADGTGVGLIGQVRARDEVKEIPIIVLAGSRGQPEEPIRHNGGIPLPKPFSAEQLRTTIEQALGHTNEPAAENAAQSFRPAATGIARAIVALRRVSRRARALLDRHHH